MKKTISLLLALVLCLSLCACKGGTDDTATTGATTAATTEGSTETTESVVDPTAEATVDPTADATESTVAPTTPAPTQCSHTYKDATCSAPKTCSKCGATEGNAAGHSWNDATCTAPKTCKKCGATNGEVIAHQTGDWITDKLPTCNSEGSQHQECTVCKTTIATETIPGAHKPGQWVLDSDTYDARYYHWRYCSACNKLVDKDYHQFDDNNICTVCASASRCTNGLAYIKVDSFGDYYWELAGFGSATVTDIVVPAYYQGLRVKEIGFLENFKNTRITSVVLPDTATKIGSSVFRDCAFLKTVHIGSNDVYISNNAFNGCSALSDIYFGGTVGIDGAAFYACRIKNVHITDLDAWFNSCFYSDFYANPLETGAKLYVNNELVETVTVPDDVTIIGKYIFSGYSYLKKLVIGKQVTGIEEYAFFGTSLETVVIPKSVTKIDEYAFSSGTIFCEASEPPLSWALNWNGDATVYWAGEWEYINGVPTAK